MVLKLLTDPNLSLNWGHSTWLKMTGQFLYWQFFLWFFSHLDPIWPQIWLGSNFFVKITILLVICVQEMIIFGVRVQKKTLHLA